MSLRSLLDANGNLLEDRPEARSLCSADVAVRLRGWIVLSFGFLRSLKRHGSAPISSKRRLIEKTSAKNKARESVK